MAKEKKRGFLSWLGIKRQDDEQEQEKPASQDARADDAAARQADVAPLADDTAARDTARDIVDITGRVAARQTAGAGRQAADPASRGRPEAYAGHDDGRDEAGLALAWDVRPDQGGLPAEGDLAAVDGDHADAREADLAFAGDVCPEQGELPAEEDFAGVGEDIADAEENAPVAWAAPAGLPAGGLPSGQSIEQPIEQPIEQQRPAREGFFARLKRGLLKTRQNLGSGFIGLFTGKKIDDDLFEQLEEQLLIADVGMDTTRKLITGLIEHADRRHLKDADTLYVKLKEEMGAILARVDRPLDVGGKTPFVILMVGVNGVGKTTTIGKLARQYQMQGKSVMLAAGDTFRAAAVEQLQVWGQRNQIPVIAQHTGADSASVIFDAIQAAKARGVDVLIADTAGRLQNKSHLMDELKKIVRVMKKLDDDAPHEVMLTLDASTGQNAISQARLFNETVKLTGITLTKLDGTAKGGVIFAVADQFGIPIRYIGVGEGIEDLRPFKADDFIEALFSRDVTQDVAQED
ncbi:signal recognition particle-docking protein FtsY [Acerihabitans arboris]|uniref:Signal recognition particle receptor FtsY n=1 Tax=Acerihabitans arboris TaxID=2691583 RepID=A0A845SI39_9GAMM|nr:signal recognition particle-docking protein FtsY [Acerihabitans arboris]NDL64560.1 signal recognition particle-docking protein FtsY [Acerihabitans arboris]